MSKVEKSGLANGWSASTINTKIPVDIHVHAPFHLAPYRVVPWDLSVGRQLSQHTYPWYFVGLRPVFEKIASENVQHRRMFMHTALTCFGCLLWRDADWFPACLPLLSAGFLPIRTAAVGCVYCVNRSRDHNGQYLELTDFRPLSSGVKAPVPTKLSLAITQLIWGQLRHWDFNYRYSQKYIIKPRYSTMA